MDKAKLQFEKLWNGEIRLAHTFWIYYFTVLFVMRTIALLLGQVIGVLAIYGQALWWCRSGAQPINMKEIRSTPCWPKPQRC